MARQQLAEWTSAEREPDDLADARLLTSELVTNALAHGHGRIELHAELDENRVRVEVIDEGKGFERIARKQDFDQLGGWGLHIVDAVASRWGIHEGSSHVWFELERRGPRIGASDKPQSTADARSRRATQSDSLIAV